MEEARTAPDLLISRFGLMLAIIVSLGSASGCLSYRVIAEERTMTGYATATGVETMAALITTAVVANSSQESRSFGDAAAIGVGGVMLVDACAAVFYVVSKAVADWER